MKKELFGGKHKQLKLGVDKFCKIISPPTIYTTWLLTQTFRRKQNTQSAHFLVLWGLPEGDSWRQGRGYALFRFHGCIHHGKIMAGRRQSRNRKWTDETRLSVIPSQGSDTFMLAVSSFTVPPSLNFTSIVNLTVMKPFIRSVPCHLLSSKPSKTHAENLQMLWASPNETKLTMEMSHSTATYTHCFVIDTTNSSHSSPTFEPWPLSPNTAQKTWLAHGCLCNLSED